jgi:hypothetical protein
VIAQKHIARCDVTMYQADAYQVYLIKVRPSYVGKKQNIPKQERPFLTSQHICHIDERWIGCFEIDQSALVLI